MGSLSPPGSLLHAWKAPIWVRSPRSPRHTRPIRFVRGRSSSCRQLLRLFAIGCYCCSCRRPGCWCCLLVVCCGGGCSHCCCGDTVVVCVFVGAVIFSHWPTTVTAKAEFLEVHVDTTSRSVPGTLEMRVPLKWVMVVSCLDVPPQALDTLQ